MEHVNSLNDVCDLIIDCEHKTAPVQDEGYPSIRTPNIGRGKLILDGVNRVSEETYRLWTKRAVPQAGDLILAREAPAGNVAIIPNNIKVCLGQRTVLIRPNKSKADPHYLLYLLLYDVTQARLLSYGSGATVAHINMSDIRRLPLPEFPPLPTQRKIASILSAYDDLIENNARRIKILEEMAQMIYREWFVKFRFPGHEKVKMVDVPVETLHATSLQKMPEGWEVKPVQNTFEILGGGTPSTKSPEYWENGNINWYSPTDLTASGTMYMEESATKITELGLQKSSARLFPAFSVMMTSRATLGVIAINTTEAATNQGFITCIPNEQFPIYTLYFWLKENVGIFVSLASGATFKEITKGVFKTIDVLVPPRHLTESFEETAGSIGTQVLNLQRRNKNLRQTRDLLLPRLISGEVDVEGFDININANVET